MVKKTEFSARLQENPVEDLLIDDIFRKAAGQNIDDGARPARQALRRRTGVNQPMKNARQSAILSMIENEDIETQEDLAARLRDRGIIVNL